MPNRYIDKWINRREQINIIGSPRLVSDELLDKVSSNMEVTLPNGFREYFWVFGRGSFEKTRIQIFIAEDSDDIEDYIEEQCEILATLKTSFPKNIELQNLVSNSFLLGLGGEDIYFLFDLRTFSQQDKSYEIYAVTYFDGGKIYALGRDFFEFISEFCIGDKAIKEFPGLLLNITDDSTGKDSSFRCR